MTTKKTKEELKNEALLHQKALEKEFQHIVVEGKKTARKAAFIGGGFLVSYLIIRVLTRKKVVVDEKHKGRNIYNIEEKKSTLAGSIGKMLMTQAAVLALRFAKDRIKEYMEHRPNKDEEERDPQ